MSDGSHIQILLLYLFAKHARFLIDYGLVYIALSPLFKGYNKETGKITYFYPNDEMDENMVPRELDTRKPFSRWKGFLVKSQNIEI